MALEKELAYFNSKKAEWLKIYKGQFALIKDEELLGTFTTEQEAFVFGVERLGNVPFLIRPITKEHESVQFPALTLGVLTIDAAS